MNEAELDLRLREDGLDGFGKTCETIHAGAENICDAPRL
jgi:hypothetical protein